MTKDELLEALNRPGIVGTTPVIVWCDGEPCDDLEFAIEVDTAGRISVSIIPLSP